MNKIPLSLIKKITTTSKIELKGWKRRKLNKIRDQTQEWLFGKEYFYSSYTQESRKDPLEMARRKNQNEVRYQFKDEIRSFLDDYRQISECLKQFIPNYTSVHYDNFKFSASIERLFRYHLITEDIPSYGNYKSHSYKTELEPLSYWKNITGRGINPKNWKEFLSNPYIAQVCEPIRLYKSNLSPLTQWYIKKVVEHKDYFTNTTKVFESAYHYQNISPEQLCDNIKQDYNFKCLSTDYIEMFNYFGATKERLAQMLKATMNTEGRDKEWAEFFAKFQRQRIHDSFFPSDSTLKQHLEVFGLRTIPTRDILKKIYRKLTFTTHPDIVGGDGSAFVKITETYNYLYNETE